MNAITKHLPTVARVFLGLIFFVLGLNGFLQFAPTPELGPEAGAFMGALAASGYLLPLVKITEIIAGALLLGNRFVPLALLLLAPVVVNITAFHVFLAPDGMPMNIAIVAAMLGLAWHHRASFRGVLQARSAGGSETAASGQVVPAHA